MRLGNLDVFCNAIKEEKERWPTESVQGILWAAILELAETCPTIDPESLPIVQQLQEELAGTKAKLEMAVHDIYSGDTGDCDTCAHGCDYADDCDSIGGCEYKWRGDMK